MEDKTKSQLLIIGACGGILIASMFLPSIGVLRVEMLRALCLLAVTVILWIKRPIPLAAASLAVIVIQPLMGLQPSLNEAFKCFTNPSTYFVIASFGVAIALKKTSLPERLIVKLLSICGGSSKKITLAFMLLTYLISTIMSDMIAVITGIGFVMELLAIQKNEPDRKQLGRLLLLSIPIASSLGGTATSVGSSLNVLALSLLKEQTGIEVSFLQWLVAGLPLSLLVLLAAWGDLNQIYKNQGSFSRRRSRIF